MNDDVRKQLEGEVEGLELQLREVKAESEFVRKGLSAANTDGYGLLNELRQKQERLEKQIQALRAALAA